MNRKQRRQQHQSSSPTNTLKSADDIPMSQPTRSKATKTLIEIAAERQAALTTNKTDINGKSLPKLDPSNVMHVTVDADGNIIPLPNTSTNLTSPTKTSNPLPSSPSSDNDDETTEQIPAYLDTLLLTISLSLLHFTLEVLAMHQYAQALEFPPLIKKTLFTAFPFLFLLIHTLRGHLFLYLIPSFHHLSEKTLTTITTVRSLIYLLAANTAGCYLIQVTNDKGYYAVMKKAPGIGVLWVWAVLEMGVVGAVAGVIGPAVYAWWNGYGVL